MSGVRILPIQKKVLDSVGQSDHHNITQYTSHLIIYIKIESYITNQQILVHY